MTMHRNYLLKHKKLFLQSSPLRCKSTLSVGSRASLTKKFTCKDVENFAELTGDVNPLHTDFEYANATNLFPKPIVHGALLVGAVSALLGTKLPGFGSIVIQQNFKFPKPVYVEQDVTATVEITKIKLNFVTCEIECTSEDTNVLTGTVLLRYLPPTKS